MEHLLNQLRVMYSKYQNFDYNEEHKKVIGQTKRIEYSRGGVNFMFGIHAPEKFSERRITNCTSGRKVKNPNKGFLFKYYFDKDDNLLLIEKYLYESDFFPAYLIFFFYLENTTEIVGFWIKHDELILLEKCHCNEKKQVNYYLRPEWDPIDGRIYRINEMNFSYENDVTLVNAKEYNTKQNPSIKKDDDNAIWNVFESNWMMKGKNITRL